MVAPFGPNDPAFLNFNAETGQNPASTEQRPPRSRSRNRPRNTSANIPDMVLVPHWDSDDGDVWNRITLDRYEFRGTARVEGEGPSLQIDKKKRPGADGARLVSKGYELAEFSIILRVWTEEHLNDFAALMTQVHPIRDPDARNALYVYHPKLVLASITHCVIAKVGLLKETGIPGLMECELRCIEYRPPTASNRTRSVAASPVLDLPLHEPFDTATARDDPNQTPPPSAQSADP